MGDDEAEASDQAVDPSLATPYPHPFKNCIVLGLMLGEDGQKMSKSKRNYREPNEIFDRYGADALRWYFFANQPPWTSIRYSEQAIKDSIPEFLLRLWNVYSFFAIYANIDEFDPSAEVRSRSWQRTDVAASRAGRVLSPVADRDELDRWILSELNRTLSRGRRADGRLRQLRGLPGDHGVRRRACPTGTSAAAAIASGPTDKRATRQARRLLDAVRVPAHDNAS